MMDESTKEVAEELELRARQPEPISPAEYRRLFIKGLAYLLREAESTSYILRRQAGNESARNAFKG
jgi:hypothetical protein